MPCDLPLAGNQPSPGPRSVPIAPQPEHHKSRTMEQKSGRWALGGSNWVDHSFRGGRGYRRPSLAGEFCDWHDCQCCSWIFFRCNLRGWFWIECKFPQLVFFILGALSSDSSGKSGRLTEVLSHVPKSPHSAWKTFSRISLTPGFPTFTLQCMFP